MVLARRPAVVRPAGSRLFTDAVLRDLKAGGYRPRAWVELAVSSGRRSIEQIAERPLAAAETVMVSAALAWLGGARFRSAAACLLAVTHLGLLGDRRSLGLANVLTLARAGLPARAGAAPFAAVLDAADGLIARRRGPTAFGSFADPLADVAFWSAMAAGPGAGRTVRTVTVLLWTAPAAGIAIAYFALGRAIDYPRWLLHRRLSAAAQVLLTLALLKRARRRQAAAAAMANSATAPTR